MSQADPFAVIETETPRLDENEVLQLVREHYGLEAELKALLSERDQNFRFRPAFRRGFCLVDNSLEVLEVLIAQGKSNIKWHD